MMKLYPVLLSLLVIGACTKDPQNTNVEPEPNPYFENIDPIAGWPLEPFEGDVESYVAPEAPFEYSNKYVYEKSEFCNPERGSYEMIEYHFRNGGYPTPYTATRLSNCKSLNITLHYVGVYLCDYLECDIPEEALNVIRTHLENERIAGTKCVLRHAYSWNSYWEVQEPELKWILRHIEQLAPIWQEYSDVICVLQAGFIGVYGEWHTTTNITTNEQKGEIVKAILDALPKSRQVATRTPYQKKIAMGYISGRTWTHSDSITVATAFDGSYNSRITNHNDCYFANSTDGGTFSGGAEKRYIKRESNYLFVGGETCFVGSYDYCKCLYVNQHMRDFHISYLRVWNEQIADYWRQNKCHTDVTSRIGYRFVLNGSAFYGHFTAGGRFLMKYCLTNYGWASLINERKLEFIIRNDNDWSEKYVFVSEKDPRDWKGCHHYEYDEEITLPETLKPGESYTLFINMPDISENLHDNPDYSVRFANKNIWEEVTGYNNVASFIAE